MTARQTYLTHRYRVCTSLSLKMVEVIWNIRPGTVREPIVCRCTHPVALCKRILQNQCLVRHNGARMVDNHHARGKTLPTITSKVHIALRLRRVRIIDSTHLVFMLRVPMRILVGKADIVRFPIERDAERGIKRLHVMQDVRCRRPG